MASTPGFALLLQNLNEVGIQIFLQLVLFIAIYFGLLRKTEVLGDDEGVQGAAAVAMGLITTFGIYSFLPAAVFTQFFALLSVLIVIVLGFMIVLGMVGVSMPDIEGGKNQRKVATVAIAALVVIIMVVFAPIAGEMYGADLFGERSTSFVLTLAMIAVIGYMVKYIGAGDAD